ncbi:membrane-associated zinc metalloprotease [Syntrophobotulus glycolicus DSM 8271]|uniref:Zinc metalloprotease n=1 Tax=Syntrophobotulus glycolicus (strain DSM 8271 / FlGlyR) TaxID=645991 RepID=F0SU98_SYNGF|nr:RIP metalloprotease RseP [Syntrophobotulus glycolicus]ADY56548.1 membrane-associated zinc metalloprotease [Syntrophobotulus glycolicus DSM 8271]
MITVLATIFVFGLMVLIHEAGHFFVAKKSGIKVLEFAFGIGPKLFGVQRGETVYSIRILPLGGFVRFLSEEELKEESEEQKQFLWPRTFESKKYWQKASVIAAGPIMNFVLGAVLFIIVYAWYGVPAVATENIVGTVMEGQPAAAAGLGVGDKILAIDGVETPDWSSLVNIIHANPDKKLEIKIQKADSPVIVTSVITPVLDQQSGQGLIGIVPQVINQKVSVLKATQYGLTQTADFTKMIVMYLVQMVTGKVPVDLGGPVAVAQVIGEGARQGIADLLSLTGILSIQFGILNLLPIPALDGGQLAVLSYEKIRRRSISVEKKGLIQLTGFALLMALMIAVTYKDIVKIIAR